MTPDQKVNFINNFIQLLQDETENEEKCCSKKKSELYGINIVPMELFTAYYMKKTKLIDGEEKIPY